MNKMANITFGEIIKSESNFPELELIITDAETNTVIGKFYLCYFRKYCFMVGGKNGNGDYGSTKPIPSVAYEGLPNDVKCEILRTGAAAAIASFVNSNMLCMCFNDHDERIFTKVESTDFSMCAPKRNFYKFIKDVFVYTFPNDEWPYSLWDEE